MRPPHPPLSPLACLREAASAKAGERSVRLATEDGVRGDHEFDSSAILIVHSELPNSLLRTKEGYLTALWGRSTII